MIKLSMFRIMQEERALLRKRVYNYYDTHKELRKIGTVSHFKDENIPTQTIYSILQRYDKNLPPERKTGSGCKAKKITFSRLNQIKSFFDGHDSVSIRCAARKFNVSKSYLHRTLKHKTSIKYRKKKKIPKRTETQKYLAKTKCGRLYRKFSKKMFILDDESYFTLSNTTMSGNNGYYASNIKTVRPEVKFRTQSKFEKKVMVWIAIGPKGLSTPFIKNSKFAINSEVYKNECIKRRLLPYIKKNYSNEDYVFWPDLASSHYSRIVQDFFKQNNINFVARDDNPANTPELRVIEDFWGVLKTNVYRKGWEAKTTDQLINRIKYCLKKIDFRVVQKLTSDTLKRIDNVRRKGLVETN